jgi:PKD repeat protein
MKFLKPTFLTALLALIVNTVYAGCKARASFTQNGNTVLFYDDSSSSQSGNHEMEWQFGDGSTGYGNQVYHSYNAPGTYFACLVIYDSLYQCFDSTCFNITISNNGGNNCNASFSYGIDSANSLKYFFSGSTPGAGLTPHWAIYDANTKNYTGQNVVHTFIANGTYNVTYSLIDSIGDTCDFVTKTVVVRNNSTPSCKASYYVALDSNNKFGLYLVNNSSGTTPNTRYFWDFGDGTTSNAQYPTHQYTNFGLYTICLTITNGNVCSSTYCDSVGLDSNGNILKTSGFGITVIDEAMLGVEEQTTAFTGVNVYPNPSSGEFTFTIDSKKGAKMTMRVMNSMGQQLAQNETYLTTGSNKTQLDLSSLSDGLYFVNLRAGDEVKSIRLYLAR